MAKWKLSEQAKNYLASDFKTPDVDVNIVQIGLSDVEIKGDKIPSTATIKTYPITNINLDSPTLEFRVLDTGSYEDFVVKSLVLYASTAKDNNFLDDALFVYSTYTVPESENIVLHPGGNDFVLSVPLTFDATPSNETANIDEKQATKIVTEVLDNKFTTENLQKMLDSIYAKKTDLDEHAKLAEKTYIKEAAVDEKIATYAQAVDKTYAKKHETDEAIQNEIAAATDKIAKEYASKQDLTNYGMIVDNVYSKKDDVTKKITDYGVIVDNVYAKKDEVAADIAKYAQTFDNVYAKETDVVKKLKAYGQTVDTIYAKKDEVAKDISAYALTVDNVYAKSSDVVNGVVDESDKTEYKGLKPLNEAMDQAIVNVSKLNEAVKKINSSVNIVNASLDKENNTLTLTKSDEGQINIDLSKYIEKVDLSGVIDDLKVSGSTLTISKKNKEGTPDTTTTIDLSKLVPAAEDSKAGTVTLNQIAKKIEAKLLDYSTTEASDGKYQPKGEYATNTQLKNAVKKIEEGEGSVKGLKALNGAVDTALANIIKNQMALKEADKKIKDTTSKIPTQFVKTVDTQDNVFTIKGQDDNLITTITIPKIGDLDKKYIKSSDWDNSADNKTIATKEYVDNTLGSRAVGISKVTADSNYAAKGYESKVDDNTSKISTIQGAYLKTIVKGDNKFTITDQGGTATDIVIPEAQDLTPYAKKTELPDISGKLDSSEFTKDKVKELLGTDVFQAKGDYASKESVTEAKGVADSAKQVADQATKDLASYKEEQKAVTFVTGVTTSDNKVYTITDNKDKSVTITLPDKYVPVDADESVKGVVTLGKIKELADEKINALNLGDTYATKDSIYSKNDADGKFVSKDTEKYVSNAQLDANNLKLTVANVGDLTVDLSKYENQDISGLATKAELGKKMDKPEDLDSNPYVQTNALNDYLTKSDASTTYATKESVNSINDTIGGLDAKYQVKGDYALKSDIKEDKFLSNAELDDNTLKLTVTGVEDALTVDLAKYVNTDLTPYAKSAEVEGKLANKLDTTGFTKEAITGLLGEDTYQAKGDYALKNELVNNFVTAGNVSEDNKLKLTVEGKSETVDVDLSKFETTTHASETYLPKSLWTGGAEDSIASKQDLAAATKKIQDISKQLTGNADKLDGLLNKETADGLYVAKPSSDNPYVQKQTLDTRLGDYTTTTGLTEKLNTKLDKSEYTKEKIKELLSTDTYQPVGNYATAGESYTKSESDDKYALKAAIPDISGKLDSTEFTKDKITNLIGADTYQPKGDYALKTDIKEDKYLTTAEMNDTTLKLTVNGVDSPVEVDLVQFKNADLSNYALKSEVEAKLDKTEFTKDKVKTLLGGDSFQAVGDYATKADVYSKGDADGKFALQTDLANKLDSTEFTKEKIYAKITDDVTGAINSAIADKVNTSDYTKETIMSKLGDAYLAKDFTYDKGTIDSKLGEKVDTNDYLTEIDLSNDIATFKVGSKPDVTLNLTAYKNPDPVDMSPYAKTAEIEPKLEAKLNTVDLTKSKITELLGDDFVTAANIKDTYLSKETANTTYLSKEEATSAYQPKGEYALKSELGTEKYLNSAELSEDNKLKLTVNGESPLEVDLPSAFALKSELTTKLNSADLTKEKVKDLLGSDTYQAKGDYATTTALEDKADKSYVDSTFVKTAELPADKYLSGATMENDTLKLTVTNGSELDVNLAQFKNPSLDNYVTKDKLPATYLSDVEKSTNGVTLHIETKNSDTYDSSTREIELKNNYLTDAQLDDNTLKLTVSNKPDTPLTVELGKYVNPASYIKSVVKSENTYTFKDQGDSETVLTIPTIPDLSGYATKQDVLNINDISLNSDDDTLTFKNVSGGITKVINLGKYVDKVDLTGLVDGMEVKGNTIEFSTKNGSGEDKKTTLDLAKFISPAAEDAVAGVISKNDIKSIADVQAESKIAALNLDTTYAKKTEIADMVTNSSLNSTLSPYAKTSELPKEIHVTGLSLDKSNKKLKLTLSDDSVVEMDATDIINVAAEPEPEYATAADVEKYMTKE